MAKKKYKKRHYVARRARAVNPRPRHYRRRRHNPIVARSRRRTTAAISRKRHYSRRRNPSAMRIGEILKDGIYGAGGAIGTRVIAGVAQGFVPGAFASSPLAAPIVQAGVAVTAVRWLGKKFLGQRQGDIMMVGGLVSAGLALADAYFPNIQSGLTSVLRAPITAFTPQTALPAQIAAGQVATAGALGDVEDVPLTAFNGFADVEDVVGLGM